MSTSNETILHVEAHRYASYRLWPTRLFCHLTLLSCNLKLISVRRDTLKTIRNRNLKQIPSRCCKMNKRAAKSMSTCVAAQGFFSHHCQNLFRKISLQQSLSDRWIQILCSRVSTTKTTLGNLSGSVTGCVPGVLICWLGFVKMALRLIERKFCELDAREERLNQIFERKRRSQANSHPISEITDVKAKSTRIPVAPVLPPRLNSASKQLSLLRSKLTALEKTTTTEKETVHAQVCRNSLLPHRNDGV